jgi:hypothetical protein
VLPCQAHKQTGVCNPLQVCRQCKHTRCSVHRPVIENKHSMCAQRCSSKALCVTLPVLPGVWMTPTLRCNVGMPIHLASKCQQPAGCCWAQHMAASCSCHVEKHSVELCTQPAQTVHGYDVQHGAHRHPWRCLGLVQKTRGASMSRQVTPALSQQVILKIHSGVALW